MCGLLFCLLLYIIIYMYIVCNVKANWNIKNRKWVKIECLLFFIIINTCNLILSGLMLSLVCFVGVFFFFYASLFSKKTSRYCHSPVVGGLGGVRKLRHFLISLLLLNVFT